MTPTRTAWLFVICGLVFLYASVWRSTGHRRLGGLILAIVLLVIGGGHFTGAWDLSVLRIDEASREEMRQLRESVPKPQR